MPLRTLGRTGVKASLIGLGGWHLGFKFIDEDLSIRIIRTAVDNGTDTLGYSSETHDDRLTISTNIGLPVSLA